MPARWRGRASTVGLQTQVRAGLLDHRLFEDRRDDPQFATAVRAVFRVDLENPLQQLGPAQPHRKVVRTVRLALGGQCACAGGSGFCANGSGSGGTTSARSVWCSGTGAPFRLQIMRRSHGPGACAPRHS